MSIAYASFFLLLQVGSGIRLRKETTNSDQLYEHIWLEFKKKKKIAYPLAAHSSPPKPYRKKKKII